MNEKEMSLSEIVSATQQETCHAKRASTATMSRLLHRLKIGKKVSWQQWALSEHDILALRCYSWLKHGTSGIAFKNAKDVVKKARRLMSSDNEYVAVTISDYPKNGFRKAVVITDKKFETDRFGAKKLVFVLKGE